MKKPTPEFLLIDAGNTRVKWAIGGRGWPRKIAGEIATKEVGARWLLSLAEKYRTHQVVLACVVPRLAGSFRRAFGDRLCIVNAGVIREIKEARLESFGFQYPDPSELGADRIAAAVAAHSYRYYPAIIVACGTATAFTVLDAKGRLCGGVIAPGLQAQLDALLGAATHLPAPQLRAPRRALAKSTRDAIRAGVVLNYQGGVKEIIRRLTEALPKSPKPHVILTGGDAPLIAGELGPRVKLRPLLVFEGLLIIGTRLWMPVP